MRALLRLQHALQAVLAEMALPWPDKAVIEPPRDPKHGDLAANVALVLGK